MTGAGLLVIGDVVTDVVARHDTPVASGTDTAAEIVMRPGGSGANTAAWAAHLGADTRLLARVGFDSSDWHIGELRRAGVRPQVRVDPDRPTAVVIAMVDPTGERSMLTNRGAGGHISAADWSDDLLDGVARLHLSAYLLFAEPGLVLARLAMARAAERGIPISVDPASTGPLLAFGIPRFHYETAAADLIIPNRDEALLLTGADTPAEAAEQLSLRYGTAIVKLGAAGALLAKAGRPLLSLPGEECDPVDSTGAGDAFAAGFLAATLAGSDDATALKAGCAAGATAVSLIGGRPRYGLGSNRLYPIHTD